MVKKQRGALMAASRKRRLHKFLSILIEAHTLNKLVDKKKLIAMASWKWGLSRRTAVEYINTLVNSGLAEESNGEIYPTNKGRSECIVPERYELNDQEKELLG